MAEKQSLSFWMDDVRTLPHDRLSDPIETEVLVVGAGIAGLSVAYEAARLGMSVAVIDRNQPGRGMTVRTTAHLASELDDYYYNLIGMRGHDAAQLYYQSQVAAINRAEAIVAELELDCDFRRVDGYRFAADSDGVEMLKKEFEACRAIGYEEVGWAELPPGMGTSGTRALHFPRQARFHPSRYVQGLVNAIKNLGGRIYGSTAYAGHEGTEGGLRIETGDGVKIDAAKAVFATNSPVNNRVTIHTKQIPYRTYVIAGKVPKGAVPDVLSWDTADPYHYVRLHPRRSGDGDILIVGGEDHRSGTGHNLGERFDRLRSWTRRFVPAFKEVEYRWSGQVMEPIDYLPFTGANPGEPNVFIHSGDSGQGITNGILAGLVIAPLLAGQKSRFDDVVQPGRLPAAAIGKFAEGLGGSLRAWAEHAAPGEVPSVHELQPGQGAVVSDGLKKLAAYRSRDGQLTEHSASCAHMGCIVHWNDVENSWDCPCHGSQFDSAGNILNGPAISSLAPARK